MTLFSRKLTAKSIFGLLVLSIGFLVPAYDFHKGAEHLARLSFYASATPIQVGDDLSKLEGKPVYAVGKPTGTRKIIDPELGLGFDALAIWRKSEIYQWVAYGKNKKKYRTQWEGEPVDSTKFKRPDGHTNHGTIEFPSYRAAAEEVVVHGIPVDPSYFSDFKEKLVPITEGMHSQLPNNIRERYVLQNGRLVEGEPVAVGQSDAKRVGANRVSYLAMAPNFGVAIGILREGHIIPATVEGYGNVGEFIAGDKDISSVIGRMERAYLFDKLMLRGFTLGMLLLAVFLITRDFMTAKKIIPTVKFGR